MLLGTVEVKGAGLEITLADNNVAAAGLIDPSSILVHYDDLLQVVNALNNAGAEAISINGQRVITTTAITCEGNVIKVNGEKISSPFVIKAIGSQGLLLGSMTMAGGYLNILEEWGVIVNVKSVDDITVEKYNGIINYKYVKNK